MVRARRPFRIDAIVILPDHLHAIWSLPAGDADYATRWQLIKRRFTKSYLATGGEEVRGSSSVVDGFPLRGEPILRDCLLANDVE